MGTRGFRMSGYPGFFGVQKGAFQKAKPGKRITYSVERPDKKRLDTPDVICRPPDKTSMRA